MTKRQHLHDQCHTFGHAWFEVDGDYKPLFGALFALECERCGTRRNDLIDAHGQLGSRNYRYPEGYREGKVSRPEYRLRLVAARPKRRTRKAS